MDFNGIAWAGNIYQKFETMCLEVEEVMYEDTVKYVENQVQTVGGSLKKFCSEVMQDLLPQSTIDSVKVVAGDLPLNCYGNTEMNKPKPIMLRSLPELKKKKTKDEDIYDLAEKESPLRVCNEANLLSPPSLTVNKRPIGIKRISRNKYPPEVTGHATSLSGDRNPSLVHEMRSSSLVNSDEMGVSTSPEFLARPHYPVEAVNVNTSISDASVASLASGNTLLADYVMPEKHDFEYDSCANDTFLSSECLRQKNDGSQCPSSLHSITTEPIDKSGKDDSFFQVNSSIGSNACVGNSAVEEVISSYEGHFDMEIIYKEEDAKPEAIENPKLEETCILVEGDDLHCVTQGTEKQKSYKKKIREALSSKLRSKKQDHFVPQHKNNTALAESDKRKFPVDDSFESDWELL